MTGRQNRHQVRVKMNREAAFGAIVKQQQARGQTVCQVKDYQSRELCYSIFPSNELVKRFPVCEAGFLFFEGKHAFNKKHVVSRNYKRLLHQDDSTKRILQVINPKNTPGSFCASNLRSARSVAKTEAPWRWKHSEIKNNTGVSLKNCNRWITNSRRRAGVQ
jgi:hypothetical protein